MNELAVDLTVPPQPFRHHVVRRPHIWRNQVRFSCVCGWRSEWLPDTGTHWPDHPDGLVTVSRVDLEPIPHPSNRGLR